MKPRELVSWAFAVCITVGIGIFGYFLFMDLTYANFPRLEALSGIKSPLIQAIIIASVSAVPASFVVFLLPSTRGDLKFSILGVKVHGPAGPILLWAIIFLVVAAVIMMALRLS